MMKLDADYVIPMILGGLVGGATAYFTGQKKANDGMISGYVDGGMAFAKDLRDAVKMSMKVFQEEMEGLSNPERCADYTALHERIHDRILNECFGKNERLKRFYQEFSDANEL